MRCSRPRRLGPPQVARFLAVSSPLIRAGGIGPTANHEGLTHMKTLILVAVSTVAISAPLATGVADAATVAKAKTFANCTALNKVYPHGVGLKNAHDHTSGTPVTNFARKPLVYKANTKSDRDKDGIACEKA